MPVQSKFRVEVSKDYLVFASAHFITFRGHQCESLHGHNYRVGVAVEGAVDSECLFVLDFSILKRIVRGLVDEIDHKVLLPTLNQKLSFRNAGSQLAVDYFGEPTYVFPRSDCALLPIANTTAEMLAQYLGRSVREQLERDGHRNLTLLELEVEENYGQSATYRESLVPD
jgi:6-pyruvoyltetrahydropterin/6-carboxytetrahydropterin synthase